MDPAIREKVNSLLAHKQLRLTGQRQAIIEAAFSSSEHFTAEDLLDRARGLNASTSRATVYRTLEILVETGLLHKLELGRDFAYYDPNYTTRPNHHHLICLDCQKIVEFEDDQLESREDNITRKLGFRPTSKHLRIEANCEALQKGFCENAKK